MSRRTSDQVQVVDLRGGGYSNSASPGRSRKNSLKRRRPSDAVPLSAQSQPPPTSVLQNSRSYDYDDDATTTYPITSTSIDRRNTYTSRPSSSHPIRGQRVVPGEQVVFVAGGRPIIIVDERKSKNAPLPTVIRDGKVVMGDVPVTLRGSDGRTHDYYPARPYTRSRTASNVSHTTPTTPVTPNSNVYVASNAPTSRSRRRSSTGHRDPPLLDSPVRRRQTWGRHPRKMPWGHYERRCRPHYHGCVLPATWNDCMD